MPDYELMKGFESPTTAAKMFMYSADGRLFAYIIAEG